MSKNIIKKISFLYNPYVLGILSLGYVLGELGHFLVGSSSKLTAADVHYGDLSCQFNASHRNLQPYLPITCESVNDSDTCVALEHNGTQYCHWNYNGLGLEYQILAGPSFMAVYTVVGVILGVAADKYNRVSLLGFCTVIMTVAIFFTGTSQRYWHLLVLRMLLAVGEAGCNPLAQGILSDLFSEKRRGLVLSIFNWGIYAGYGLAFPFGRYVPEWNLFGLSWRLNYFIVGLIGVIISILTFTTLKEPKRQETAKNEDALESSDAKQKSIWKIILSFKFILLTAAASIRHLAGLVFAYNSDLYYRQYYPHIDLAWPLFGVTVFIGGLGVVVGGVVSDKYVEKMGVRSRLAILAISQILATPFAFGALTFEPLWAMINLAVSYFFAEMWFGIIFAVLVEIVPMQLRSTTIGVFLFVINNIGGILSVFVDPVSKSLGYRDAMYIFHVGAYALSALIFFFTMFLMKGGKKQPSPQVNPKFGHDNAVFTLDETSKKSSNPNLNGVIFKSTDIDHSKL